MQERHLDKERYFNEQVYTTENYVVPFIEPYLKIDEHLRVLEIGCGEAGNLKPFLDRGCEVVGVDLSESKIAHAKKFYERHKHEDRSLFISENIYESNSLGTYDLIITRDVIEHIPDQERFMRECKKLLKPGGMFFLGFPPWYNPFGGHQQVLRSKLLSKLPYFHLLPGPLYPAVLKAFGENDQKVSHLKEIRDTGISLDRFERICKQTNYKIIRKTYWLFNPNYEIKFKLKPLVQTPMLSWIPFFRNFIITAGYYLVSPGD